MKLSKAAVFATALAVSVGAQATDYFFGPHDPLAEASFAAGVGGGFVPGAGFFTDAYIFDLSAEATLTSTVVALNQAPILTISGGSYFILSAGADNDFSTPDNFVVPASTFSFDGTTGSTPHSVALAAGTYAYVVQGTTAGLGGSYSLVSSPVPVPEPETLSLMLAGVGLLGFAARRRL